MRRIELDYQRRPALAYGVGVCLLFFALFVAAGAAVLFFQLADARDAARERLARHDRAQSRLVQRAMTRDEVAQQRAEVKRANEIAARLDLPWGALFKAVESASMDSVALLGIQPDAQKRSVNIAAESRDLAGAVAYAKRLSQEAVFAEVHIINHQVQEQEPQKPLRFEIQAIWRERPGK